MTQPESLAENRPVPVPPGSLILASGSPRRREILARMGLEFEIHPPDLDETALPGEAPENLVVRLARSKARAVAESLQSNPRRWVLGSDTVVVLDGETIGKPRDAEDAVQMLLRLTGRTHRVITGIAVVDALSGRAEEQAVISEVVMRPAEETEIRGYVATGESLDKAGAYALQGEGRRFVTRVMGSQSNVIGLPIDATRALLARAAGGGHPPETNPDRRGTP